MKIMIQILRILNLMVSITAIGTLVWFHGYKYTPTHLHNHMLYMHISFGFYLCQFIIKGFLSKNISSYLSDNRIEYLIFIALIASISIDWLFNFSISYWLLSFTGISDSNHLYVLFIHVWLLVIVGIELAKVASKSTIWRLSPPLLLIVSFIVLITLGSSLLMLPEMTVSGNGMPFLDALFTSVSANTVTGLSTIDVATYFTLKGKIILLILIQLGGLNIIFFASFFISRFHQASANRQQDIAIKEILHTSSLSDSSTKRLLKNVLISSLLIELVGAIILYFQWNFPVNSPEASSSIFYSVFHSVSGFNNAGFSLFTDGFNHSLVNGNLYVHITLTILIILGGLGFATLWDLAKLKRLLVFRFEKIKFSLNSRIALISSFSLILLGFILFYLLEYNGTLENMTSASSVVTSFFQSITARTAGFSTVQIGELGIVSIVLLMVLMFIGASSGSTGGGIKTSTFSILLISLFKRKTPLKEKKNQVLDKIINKAVLIVLFSIGTIVLGAAILFFSEENIEFNKLLFEEVSAFSTVGLSTGITSEISSFGKIVVMATMFIGRVGPLAIAYALVKESYFHKIDNHENIMIG